MSFNQLLLLSFAAGTFIHGVYVVLAAKLWHVKTGSERDAAFEGLVLGLSTFLWQCGNLIAVLAMNAGFPDTSRSYQTGAFIRNVSLVCFPLLFSYMCMHFDTDVAAGRGLLRFGRSLGYPLWPWTVLAITSLIAFQSGFSAEWLDFDLVQFVTLHTMLLYFLIFTIVGILRARSADAAGARTHLLAHRAATWSGLIAAGMFVLMLGGYWFARIPVLRYVELAAMMTSVPFTIASAYRFFQFPFMDVFVREALSGTILFVTLVLGLALQPFVPAGWTILWIAAVAIVIVYAKPRVTQWVERTFMGHDESVEQQEERIGNAIRGLTQLDELGSRASELLRSELDSEWVEIDSTRRPDAAHCFGIPGASALWLCVGPRVGGRQYMSRELRLARTAALQLSAHHHQLTQYELRAVTARAQMRALQAQINPHFLFNTLNVLANLIHSNPAKAEHVTEGLAEVFRYALESTRSETVKLDDELHFLEAYLEIEKARFEERLAYSFDVDPAIRPAKIPPMILQPLVENAIKHGIGPKIEGGCVRISARIEGDRLILVVEDTGVGPAGNGRQRGSGIGLSNVRERLRHAYGDSTILKLEEMQPAGTRAVLTLPQLLGVRL